MKKARKLCVISLLFFAFHISSAMEIFYVALFLNYEVSFSCWTSTTFCQVSVK